MESQQKLYNKLKQLYAGKGVELDIFSRGRQIEELVKKLVGEIANPYEQEQDVKIGNNVFDGLVKINGESFILYEVFAGKLSPFRYERLLELVESLHVPRKAYFLIIAQSFSNSEKPRIRKLSESVYGKHKDKVKLAFIDVETLISLHRFTSKMQTETHYGELKTLKKLFLTRLFECPVTIEEKFFNEAWVSARQEFRDVFICHASLDKEMYVYPFIDELRKLGISYWIDEAEIDWADSIFMKINEGLRISQYVLVFLSETFIGKNWPEAELASALNKENAKGEKVVLPIIIGDPEVIFERYPLLRGKRCVFWREGAPSIALKLKSILDRSDTGASIFYSFPLLRDHLLKELTSYHMLLCNLEEKKRASDIEYLMNNFLRILLANYGVYTKNEVTSIYTIFQSELQSPSSPLFRLTEELQDSGHSPEEIQRIIANIISVLKQKTVSPDSEKQANVLLSELSTICMDVLIKKDNPEVKRIRELLSRGESSNLDFKSSLRWDKQEGRINKEIERSIAKTVASLMNSEGGTLILGVDDTGNVCGLGDDFATFQSKDSQGLLDTYNEAFFQLMFDKLGGPKIYQLIHTKFVEIDGKLLFVATIKKSDAPIYFTHGDEVGFYVRVGPATRRFNVREVVEYHKIHFESDKKTY